MNYLKICLSALLSIIELFILTKIMGKRQISQLSLFDYINGITIGSIAAEMAIGPLADMGKPAVAMLVYSLIAVILSFASNKSIALRRFIVGKSLILMDNGHIYRDNLAKSSLDLNEFLTQCRTSGYFNLDNLQTVIMEPNGKLSFLPKSENAPLTPKDMKITKENEKICVVVVSDGEVLPQNLKSIGKNEIWLKEELKNLKNYKISDIFIAFYDGNRLSAYEKENKNSTEDYFC